MIFRCVIALVFVFTLINLSSIQPESPVQASTFQQEGGPYFDQIYSASSPDGLTWTHDGKLLLDHASAPTAVVTREGKILLYYVDATKEPETTNCAISEDGGKTFTPLNLTIQNLTVAKTLDPSVVRLKDGRYRLYYFNGIGTQTIFSAISDDGIHFTQETAVLPPLQLIDGDVFKGWKEWLMVVASFDQQQGSFIAASRDGTNFQVVKPFVSKEYRPANPLKIGGGKFRLYAFNLRGGTIESFVSTNGLDWTAEPGIRLAPLPGHRVADPMVIQLPDKSWKMFYRVQN